MITDPKTLTVAALWLDFAGEVLVGAPEMQRTEMRKAFYAGFLQALMTLPEISSQMSEKAAVEVLDRLDKEVKGYLGVG